MLYIFSSAGTTRAQCRGQKNFRLFPKILIPQGPKIPGKTSAISWVDLVKKGRTNIPLPFSGICRNNLPWKRIYFFYNCLANMEGDEQLSTIYRRYAAFPDLEKEDLKNLTACVRIAFQKCLVECQRFTREKHFGEVTFML